MDTLIKDYPGLLGKRDAPCVSLYQPTHRHHPDAEQDPIRFGNLTKEIEERLLRQHPAREIASIMEPFRALADDRNFWNHALDGLAVLAAPGMFRHYRLQRPVKELVVVADSFHTKPLLRIVQSADRYQILALTRKDIRLFEGNRDVVDEVALDARVPRTPADALGEEAIEPTPGSVFPASRATGVGRPAVMQGFGEKSDAQDSETERFFRAADRAVLEHHSQAEGLPLFLAALPEHQALFRRVSHNAFLMPDAIDVHPDSLGTDGLRERAWQVVGPYYLQRLQGLVERFNVAKARDAAEEDLARVAEAAAAGRIATLLVDADRHVWGHLDRASGRIRLRESGDPATDDLIDDIGELVIGSGGEVVVVPAERMPASSGVAAIYRY